MRIATTKPLLAWDCLEDSPTLKTIQQLLEVIPDTALLESLRTNRGKGRNDCPVLPRHGSSSRRTVWQTVQDGMPFRPTLCSG